MYKKKYQLNKIFRAKFIIKIFKYYYKQKRKYYIDQIVLKE